MNLTANSCTLVPLHLKRRISSLQVHGNFCIELHHTWNCVENGTFAQLRPGSPKYDDLRFWVGHDNQAVSISLCGYDCHNETKVESSNGTQNNITNNSTVTIFDEDDALFNGMNYVICEKSILKKLTHKIIIFLIFRAFQKSESFPKRLSKSQR